METIAVPTDNSHRDIEQTTTTYTAEVANPGTYVADLSLVQCLDHLEALRLFEESPAAIDDRFEAIRTRSDQLIRAMDAAAELSGVSKATETALSIRFDQAELALLALAHSHAAEDYREEGFPDTAETYERHQQEILRALADPTGNRSHHCAGESPVNQ